MATGAGSRLPQETVKITISRRRNYEARGWQVSTRREDSVSRTGLTRAEMLEAAKSIRRLLDLLRAGELPAPARRVARLEGALVATEVVATGQRAHS